jgi:hypothetical protein
MLTILKLIASTQSGRGGHNHTMCSIMEALGDRMDVLGVNVGTVASPVHAKCLSPIHYLPYESIRATLSSLTKIVHSESPDVIHAYDKTSAFFGRELAKRSGLPFLMTKCGGPNPVGYYPSVRDIVVFSRENVRFFEAGDRKQRVHHLPHRVRRPRQDKYKVRELRSLFRPDSTIVLRICRVGSTYEQSILQGGILVRQLRSAGVDSDLLVVGIHDGESDTRSIESAVADVATFVSDDHFTCKAAEIIDAGDIVIGTGRGLMEAAAVGKPLLAPLRDSDCPALVDEDSFEALFDFNFSERSSLPNFDADQNLRRILHVATNKDAREQAGAFASNMFEQHFNIDRMADAYERLYESLRPDARTQWTDRLLHLAWLKRNVRTLEREQEYLAGLPNR